MQDDIRIQFPDSLNFMPLLNSCGDTPSRLTVSPLIFVSAFTAASECRVKPMLETANNIAAQAGMKGMESHGLIAMAST
jgi:hypothetical protein